MQQFLFKMSRRPYFPYHFTSILVANLISLALILSLGTISVWAAQVRLAWDPNTEEDLGGYKVYYGVSSGDYDSYVDAGNQLEIEVSGLEDGVTYYFAATAYDLAGDESGYSNEVVYVPQVSCAYSISPTGLPFSGSGVQGWSVCQLPLPATGRQFQTHYGS